MYFLRLMATKYILFDTSHNDISWAVFFFRKLVFNGIIYTIYKLYIFQRKHSDKIK